MSNISHSDEEDVLISYQGGKIRLMCGEQEIAINPTYAREIANEILHITKPCREYQLEHELFGADPNCDGIIIAGPGGGLKCSKCHGWFCF